MKRSRPGKKPDKLNVSLLWNADSRLKKYLEQNAGSVASFRYFGRNASPEKLYKGADVLIGWRPDKELLLRSETVRYFINPGTGIKHLVSAFREINSARKVTLINGHGHSYNTAQHTVSMLLALMNRLVQHHKWMEEGIWRTSDDRDIFSASILLKNRKIGLMGYGAINTKVHRFLAGFENEFLIFRRSNAGKKKTADFAGNAVTFYGEDQLDEFMKKCDIVIIAVPHTGKTENLIRARHLRLLGRNGLLVNVARGAIVNEKDLYHALRNNVIAGAALDVWYNYSPEKNRQGKQYPFSQPFHRLKNVLMSPHRAASPFDELERWDEVIENLKRIHSGNRKLLNVVDLEQEY